VRRRDGEATNLAGCRIHPEGRRLVFRPLLRLQQPRRGIVVEQREQHDHVVVRLGFVELVERIGRVVLRGRPSLARWRRTPWRR
jgi:hypothetical protein